MTHKHRHLLRQLLDGPIVAAANARTLNAFLRRGWVSLLIRVSADGVWRITPTGRLALEND